MAMSTCSTVKYTLIPCDASEPFQELELSVPPTLEENIGCLTTVLNDHYRRTAPIRGAEGKQAVIDSVKKTLKQNVPDSNPSEQMLNAFAQSQTVDIVQLMPATAATGFVGVSMYVDDQGQGKGSAPNARASKFCMACGLPTDVVGDAFVARAWDDQDGFERRDFTISEISSDAPWVLDAYKLNQERRDPTQAAQQLSAMSQASAKQAPPPDKPLADRLPGAAAAKGEGTERFKAGDLEGAAAKYAEAVAALIDPEGGVATGGGGIVDEADVRSASELLVTSLVNLATCRLRQERPYEAIESADSAIKLDESNGKAWFRRGQACMALQQYAAGRRNLGRAAQLLPSSREVRAEYEKCVELAAQKKANAFDAMSD